MAVARGASADFMIRRQMVPQRVDELIEKAGHPELDFCGRRRRNRSRRHLRAAAADELLAVLGNEFVEHGTDRIFLMFCAGRSSTARPSSPTQGAIANRLWGSEPTMPDL